MTDEVNLSELLAANYVLGSLTIRTWGATKTDREASDGVNAQAGASANASRVVKKLFAGCDEQLAAATAAYTGIRTWFYSISLSWSAATEGARRGDRIIAALDTVDILKEYTVRKRQADAALEVLVSAYDAMIDASKEKLGGLWKATDYPSAGDMRRAFGAQLDMRPIPVQADFNRAQLPVAITKGLQRLYEQRAQQQVTTALGDFQQRLVQELVRMYTQLGKVARGEKTRVFKSLVENMEVLARLAKSLAPISPEMAEWEQRMRDDLLQHKVEDLKSQPLLARKVASAANRFHVAITGHEVDAEVPAQPEAEPEQATEDSVDELDMADVDNFITL